MSQHNPVGGRIMTLPVLFLGVLVVIAAIILADRFMNGLGAVTNLTNAYPWGVWVVYDIVIGTAFACGGYALAIVIYIMNKGKYHPLIRPAILASLFGYTLGGLGAFIDMGRYWQAYNILLPWNQNYNSVMLEVGLCVAAYIIVLLIEFSPAYLEKIKAKVGLERLNKILFFVIALGVVLPTMHQSSLGSLLIALGHKVTPLWQSVQLMPLLALISALTMGFSIVIFEASFVAAGFRRKSETNILAGLGKIINVMLIVWLVVRFAELLMRGKIAAAFAGDLYSVMFWIETALFIIPLLILASAQNRNNAKLLLIAAVSMLFAGALYRLNAFLIGFDPGPGYTYFPSVSEIMVSVGLVAFEILAYIVIVKKLPVLHRAEHA